MDKKRQILEFRKRLDKTLASPTLVSEESIKSLVKSQLLRSSFINIEEHIEAIVQRRTVEVSNFLEMLRSVSGGDGTSKDWKLKQDNGQMRVMYREGPEETPFHTLLCEGYVEGPIDVCLCVSWESTLYKKWWPQFNIPPFKVNLSTCLQKLGVGEEISLVRVKVPWPVSAREAVLHYFELEYFEDDLIIVLINTVSDIEDIAIRTHGFSSDKIPEAKDFVRIGLVGGFALQKVTSNRCYFRTITNLDIKLDFVPPAMINFVSRQLIGSGFKLYQKTVASVSNGDQDYSKILKEGPMYIRIREGQKSYEECKHLENFTKTRRSVDTVSEQENEIAQVHKAAKEHTLVSGIMENARHPLLALEGNKHVQVQDALKSSFDHEELEALDNVNSISVINGEGEARAQSLVLSTIQKHNSEVHKDEAAKIIDLVVTQHAAVSSTPFVDEHFHDSNEKSFVSPNGEQYPGILYKAIALDQGHEYPKDSTSGNKKSLNLGIVARSSSTSSLDNGAVLRIDHSRKSSEDMDENLAFYDCRTSWSDYESDNSRNGLELGNQDVAAPGKLERYVNSSNGVIYDNVKEQNLQKKVSTVAVPSAEDSAIHKKVSTVIGKKKSKRKKHRFCCFRT